MGSICPTKSDFVFPNEQFENKEAINITGENQLGSLEFQFTCQKLIHLQADFLLLFMDKSLLLTKIDHFSKLPTQRLKVEQYAQAYIQKTKMKIQDASFMIFPIMVPTLNFKKVAIIFNEPWEKGKEEENTEIFLKNLELCFQQMFHEETEKLVIAQIAEMLGIPCQKGAKLIIQQLKRGIPKVKKIQFCCLSEDSKKIYVQAIEGQRQNLQKSFSSSSIAGSDYY